MTPENLRDTDRVEAFSDGVLAVVATLLVLDIHVLRLSQAPTTAELVTAFRPVAFALLSFTLSFLFVVIVWVNHHQIFFSLRKADRGLLWANNLLLLCMCLLPFPTALVGTYPALPVGPILLSGVLCAASLAFFTLVRHALKADCSRRTSRSVRETSSYGEASSALRRS